MFLAVIQAFAETASFRLPETHTFHKSLPLPPYTTCVGMLGAALGFSMEQAQEYVEGNGILIGAAGKGKGAFKDLWKYRKVKADGIISDVLIREYYVDLSMTLIYAADNEELSQRIAKGFSDPVYVLTAGNSDSLMRIRSVSVAEGEYEPLQRLESCVVPGDLTGRYKPDRSVFERPITETIQAPTIFHLPVRFTFEGEKRAIAAREPFTFVGHPVQLEESVHGITVGNSTVVLR